MYKLVTKVIQYFCFPNRPMKVWDILEFQKGGESQKRGKYDTPYQLWKETYVAFIDIEKAYDKVWTNAIFYLLWNWEIKGKLWRIMYKLNQNLKATIATKFGQTDVINIEV